MSETTSELDVPEAPQHFYLTLSDDDENSVLELVRVDGESMYIRKDGDWLAIDPDADNQRVWDRQIIDVSEDAAEVFDDAHDMGAVTRDQFTEHEILDEEAA